MHRQLLFQVSHFFLVAFDKQGLISGLIDDWLVLYLLHASGEPQSRHCLLEVMGLRPDIRYKNGVAVSANRVPQHVCELGLAVRHVVSLLIRGTDNDLLQEGERSVDVAGLAHRNACSTCLLCAFVASQVDQVKLARDYLL